MLNISPSLQIPVSAATIAGGFTLLWWTSKKVVELAASLAKQLGVNAFLIGSVISGVLTSFPELIVSVSSIIQGTPQVSLGNIYGANLCDLTLAISAPLLISQKLSVTKTEVESLLFMLMMSGFSMLVMLTPGAKPGFIGPILMTIYALMIYSLINRNKKTTTSKTGIKAKLALATSGKLLGSLAGALIAGNAVVMGAKILSSEMEVMIETIGASAFALGTTIPEIVVNIAAARAKQTGLIFGNAVGSALSQTLLALGFLATFAPKLKMTGLSFSVPWIFLIYFVLGYALFKNREVRRLEALVLTGLFACFVIFALKTGTLA